MSGTQSPGEKFISLQISEAHSRLQKLEVKDRQYWIAMVALMLLLVAAMFVLTTPGIADSIVALKSLKVAVWFLLGLVFVFGITALRKQRTFAQVRRELSSELAVIAAAEMLNINNMKAGPDEDRREAPRAACNQRVNVSAHGSEGPQYFYGRIIDICEHGIGAIIPAILAPGQEVVLEFSLHDEETLQNSIDPARRNAKPIKVGAIVRQRSGFRYGFNFVAPSESDVQEIESYRGTGKVVSIAARVP